MHSQAPASVVGAPSAPLTATAELSAVPAPVGGATPRPSRCQPGSPELARSPAMKPSRALLIAYNVSCAVLLGAIGLSSLAMLNS
jgi:hypothetical protein